MKYEETRFGFNYGSAIVERMFSDEKKGWVCIGIRTEWNGKRRRVQVYVTRTGRIRVASASGEWKRVPR